MESNSKYSKLIKLNSHPKSQNCEEELLKIKILTVMENSFGFRIGIVVIPNK